MRKTLDKMLKTFRESYVATLTICLMFGMNQVGRFEAGDDVSLAITIVLVVSLAMALVPNASSACHLAHRFMTEQPPDAILLDVGRALIDSLRDSQLIARGLRHDYVRVVEQPDCSYEVFLDHASPEESERFISAFREVFQPAQNQHYLILRDDSRLPSLPLSPFWFVLRGWYRRRWGYRPSYHPVPKVLAASKERAGSLPRTGGSMSEAGSSSSLIKRSDAGAFSKRAPRRGRRCEACRSKRGGNLVGWRGAIVAEFLLRSPNVDLVDSLRAKNQTLNLQAPTFNHR